MRVASQLPLVEAGFASLWKREVGRDFIMVFSKILETKNFFRGR